MQVSATHCSGGYLVARAEVVATTVAPLAVTVAVAPRGGLGVETGIPIAATLGVVAGADAFPVQLHWRFSGSTTLGRMLATPADGEAGVRVQRVYSDPGIYPLEVSATDVGGRVTATVRTLVVTARIAAQADRGFGGALHDAGVFALAPATTVVAVAAGRDGLLLAREEDGQEGGDGDGNGARRRRLAARIAFGDDGAGDAVAVAVDRRRRIAYVATVRDGLAVVDVTDPAAPAMVPPEALFPPGEAPFAIDRVWLCRGGRWIFVRDRGRAVRGFELADEFALARRRQGGDAGPPWQPMGGNGRELLLAHPEAAAVACAGERWVAVGDGAGVTVYDMASFFAGGQAERAQRLGVPGEAGPGGIAVGFHQSASAVTGLDVAFGADGAATYENVAEDGSLRLEMVQHVASELRDTFAPGGVERIADAIGAVGRAGGRWLLSAAGASNRDGLLALEPTSAPAEVSRTYVYEPTNKCATRTYNGGIYTFGDAFPDMAACRIVGAARRLLEPLGDRSWQLLDGAVQPLAVTDATPGEPWPLPPPVGLGAIDEDGTWILSEQKAIRFPIAGEVGDRVQAPPTTEVALGLGPDTAAAGSGALVVAGGGLVQAVMQTGPGQVGPWQAGPTVAVQGIVRQVVLDAPMGRVAVRQDGGAVAVYELISEGELMLHEVVEGRGYTDVAVCGGTVYGLRVADGGESLAVDLVSAPPGGSERALLVPFRRFADIDCGGGVLVLLGVGVEGDFEVQGWANDGIDGDLGALLWTRKLPLAPGSETEWGQVFRAGGWTAVHVRGRGGAWLFYAQAEGGPEFRAADYTDSAARWAGAGVVAVDPDRIRYAGMEAGGGGGARFQQRETGP